MAAERLLRDGPNELRPPRGTPECVKFGRQLAGGLQCLMWVAAAICLIAYGVQEGEGDRGSSDNVRWTPGSICGGGKMPSWGETWVHLGGRRGSISGENIWVHLGGNIWVHLGGNAGVHGLRNPWVHLGEDLGWRTFGFIWENLWVRIYGHLGGNIWVHLGEHLGPSGQTSESIWTGDT